MSYGILVQNPGINRVILDENHPIYVVPPIRVVGWTKGQSASRVIRGNRGEYTSAWSTTWQEFELRFRYPLAGQLPPLTFIHPSFASSYGASRIYGEPSNGYSRDGWQSNMSVVPLGGAGNWTGVKVRISATDTVANFGAYNQNGRKNAENWVSNMLVQVPNLSSFFIAVGYGVEPRPGEYGIIVRNASGEVVFNSNSNVAVGVGCNSNWQYINRGGGDGTYVERWRLPVTPPSDAYRLVIPTQTYRRYNGETAGIMMRSYKGSMIKFIVGGRSGSPAFTPMMWIRTMKALERW